jgi:protein-disulfide isomerase
MAENVPPPAGKKKPHPLVFVGVIAVILVILGFAQLTSRVNEDIQNAEQTEQTAENVVEGEEGGAIDVAEDATIDVNEALSDRILGNPSAPVKISEHASFTCGHCGEFHKTTFDALKTEFIDTGKAYLVFSDFPLNAPAVHASMVARCLPTDKYFDFVSMLFKTQEDWAYDANYLDYLKTKSGEAGLSEAKFQACINSTELQEGIVNRMKGVQAQWNISSTPSFVINNRTTISGAYPIDEFRKMIAAEASGQQATPPSEPPAHTHDEESSAEQPADVEPAAAEDEATPDPSIEGEEPAATESEEGTKAE